MARVFFLVPMVMGLPGPARARGRGTRAGARRSPRGAAARPVVRVGRSARSGHRRRRSAPPSTPPRLRPRPAPSPATPSGGASSCRRPRAWPPGPASPPRASAWRSGPGPTRTPRSSGLRFVARKCEITPAGLKVSYADGSTRDVAYAAILSVVVRLLPPDPPWSSQPFFDAVVRSADNTAWQAVRVFSTTIVQLRRPARRRLHLAPREHAPAGGASPRPEPGPEPRPGDGGLRERGKPPVRFVSTNHFAEYDQRYS